ncbi:MGDG synthase family glycosyltransferase [Peribacillus tepidiphilus]|uniref:MGDG synthase family glycosyltransferase n=1 Tax=Peribacillus tepidiphilus TaxID=2652445 RepID=UPI00129157C8|nr:glycosyltransferase [Peribacillus tepidiphilus]
MKRVLFMPFLQISSGHHHVADGLIDELLEIDHTLSCEKIDILSFGFGKIEGIVSAIYLRWIHLFPSLYSWIYHKSVFDYNKQHKQFHLYERLFSYWMTKLIELKKPDLIICTHALPSCVLNQLKGRKKQSIPVINVYTDYFINQIWGIESIDYHFVPSQELKEFLISRGVESDRILVTGIPIHPQLKKEASKPKKENTYSLLISGGNQGAGLIKSFIKKLKPGGNIHYTVLCGKNKKLYRFINEMKNPMIKPMPYISSREEMNQIYHNVDAIITKPGGVTISECLTKRIPIFVYHALPGQEEINLRYLKNSGLVFHLNHWNTMTHIEDSILTILDSEQHQSLYKEKLNTYHQQLSKQEGSNLILDILANHRTNQFVQVSN